MSTREATASPLLAPAPADRRGPRALARPLARPSRAPPPQTLVSAVAAGRARDPRDARRERRAEHDRLRHRRRAVRARVLRAVHPGPVRDGIRLPGDVHARRRGHPPRLRRARAAALRTRCGAGSAPAISRSPTSSRWSPSSSRSASGSPTSTSAPAWPSRSGWCSSCSRSAAGATGAGSGSCSAWRSSTACSWWRRSWSSRTSERWSSSLRTFTPVPRRQLQHAAAAAGLHDRRDRDAVDDLLPAERLRRQGHDPRDISHGRYDTAVGAVLAAVFGCGALIAGRGAAHPRRREHPGARRRRLPRGARRRRRAAPSARCSRSGSSRPARSRC